MINNIMNYQTLIHIAGWLAAGLSIIRMIPQLVKMIRTKSTKEISSFTQILSILYGVLFTIYGFMSSANDNMALIITNLLVAVLGLAILIAKYSVGQDDKMTSHTKIALEKEYISLKIDSNQNKTQAE